MYKILLSRNITSFQPVAIAFAIIIIRVSLHVHVLVLIHKAVKYSFVRSVCKKGLRYTVLTSYLIDRRSYIYTYNQSSIFHQQIAKIVVRFTRKETGEKENVKNLRTHILHACM